MQIVGYTAERTKSGVRLMSGYSGYNGKPESRLARSFQEAVSFLTDRAEDGFSVCWDLGAFAEALFSLLPEEQQEELKGKPRVFVDGVKIFYTERLLGLTYTRKLHDNFVEKCEINLYALQHWLPDDTPVPQSVLEVVKLGEGLLETLKKAGIYPTKLTSPIAVWAESELNGRLPTMFSFREEWLEAMVLCESIMRHEWRECFKVGYWEEACDFDMVSAYPAFIKDLPNTDHCFCQKSDTYIASDWAVMPGIVEVTAPVSPITYDDGENYTNPVGRFPRVMTSEEAEWLERRKAGSFRMTGEGWFFRWGTDKPYRNVVDKLFEMRNIGDANVAHFARRIGHGLSGKLDEDHKDGKLGDLYNPILALLTRSRCRLAVADFIYGNGLVEDAIAVQVDGVLSSKQAQIPETGEMGSWRLDAQCPACVLGEGMVWLPHKKPMGIEFDEIVKEMRKHPKRGFYQFGDRVIDLPIMARDTGRRFKKFPQTGGEVLGGVYGSEPIKANEG